ncbi:hypothetical protein HDU86_007701 [Geranomyces michiganensis]|nr:hypothetical protein HDU86_007701 [Geranomyces michiganensis]
MLSSSQSFNPTPPATICKSLLQVLNTWDTTRHDPHSLDLPMQSLARTAAQVALSGNKDEKRDVCELISAVETAVQHVRMRKTGAAEQAAVCVGALLAALSKKKTLSDCHFGLQDSGPRPRTMFIRHGGVTRRVRFPTDGPPLTAKGLGEMIDARFPSIHIPSPLHEDELPAVDVRDPCSGVWYRLEDVDDLTDGVLMRVGREDADDVREERGPTARQPSAGSKKPSTSTSDKHIRAIPPHHSAPKPPHSASTSTQTDNTTTPPASPPHPTPLDSITTELALITTDTNSIEDRLQRFREIIDALASDAAATASSRGYSSAQAPTKISAAQLAALRADGDALNADIARRRATLEHARPRWKAAWARGLEDIVAQQTALSRHENMAVELEGARVEMAETVEKILSVAEMLAKRETDAEGSPFVPAVLSAEEAESARLAPVLDELKVAVVAAAGSADRLEEAERWAEVRQWKLQAEKDYGESLLKWIRQAALKETGGIERVERMRTEKDAEHRRAVLSN